jgi:hypothetical protein
MLIALGILAGCASTRVAAVGPVAHDSLVQLVVTEDRDVVRRECPDTLFLGRPAGCHVPRSRLVTVDGRTVREVVLVKLVRFTDRLPSAMAFEIEAHELCHAIAAIQRLPDPCHIGNAGILEHAPPPPRLR